MIEDTTLSFKHPDGKTQTVQAQISSNELILNKIFKVESERTVVIDRNPKGGLGISVKGGAEHGIPVLISRVFMETANDNSLQPGDAIIAVNGKKMDNLLHDEVVAELRNCGPCVQLTVRPFEEAHQVLQLAGSSKASDVLDENDKQIEGGSSTTDGESPRIPLSFTRLELYSSATTSIMNNEIRLTTSDDKFAGTIKLMSHSQLENYYNHLANFIIKTNINALENTTDNNRIGNLHYANWVDKLTQHHPQGGTKQLLWVPCFIVVSDESIYIFNNNPPPRDMEDIGNCKNKYRIEECLIRDHHLHNELFDSRPFCCSIQCDGNVKFYINLNTKDQLVSFVEKTRKLSNEAVFRIRKRSYDCTLNEESCQLTLNIDDGFTMLRHKDQTILWNFKFSQLAQSFDDGKNLIKFQFQIEDGTTIQKVFTCEEAYHLLYCVHSFLLAKLSIFGMNNDEMFSE